MNSRPNLLQAVLTMTMRLAPGTVQAQPAAPSGDIEYRLYRASIAPAFHLIGQVLATGASDGTARDRETRTGTEVRQHRWNAKGMTVVAWSPDERRLPALDRSGGICLYDSSGAR